MKEHRNLIIFLLMLILVPLAGEPKIHPFSGELSDFRVSFGSPIFLLFLLWLRNTPFIAAGFFTGITVVVFRALLDFWAGTATFNTALWLHLPTFFYYFVYATCFHLPHFDEALYHKALQIAGWSIIAEIIASIAELFTMSISISGSVVLTPDIFLKIAAIAVLRCFFILSFFFLSQIYTAEMRAQQEHKQKQRMMLLISNLYEEVVQLDKSQKNAEEITRNCYNSMKTFSPVRLQSTGMPLPPNFWQSLVVSTISKRTTNAFMPVLSSLRTIVRSMTTFAAKNLRTLSLIHSVNMQTHLAKQLRLRRPATLYCLRFMSIPYFRL